MKSKKQLEGMVLYLGEQNETARTGFGRVLRSTLSNEQWVALAFIMGISPPMLDYEMEDIIEELLKRLREK